MSEQTIGLTGIAHLESEMRARLAAKNADIERYRTIIVEMLAALEGVVRVADRKTVEFDAAHAAIAKAKKWLP